MSTPKLSDISAICIDGLEQQVFNLNGERKDTLSGINFINVFIGENSAGKSRLLRGILTKPVNHINLDLNFKTKLKQTILDRMNAGYNSNNASNSILKELPNAPLESGIGEWVYKTVEQYYQDKFRRSSPDQVNKSISQVLGSSLHQELNELAGLCVPTLKLLNNREYIPLLRGLRPLDSQKDLFTERTNSDYFDFKGKQGVGFEIFTGYTLYSDLMHSLLGLEEERESIKRFESYLSKHFFGSKKITLIPKKDRDDVEKSNDVVYVKIGEEEMLPIYKLGDGIQAIITLTVRPFLAKEPTVFFIEEPEQHLHAGMQRALIRAFQSCPQHKYFFTTQSNHFIDLSLESDDLSLFSVKKVIDENNYSKAEVTNQKDRSGILKDLGVLASSVLLANCSIWVEGITDKLYLRVYLQRFLDELKAKSEALDDCPNKQQELLQRHKTLSSFNENLHYVFVEYQGSNITHWDFSDSAQNSTDTPARMLSRDIFLLADQDIKTKGNRVRDLREAMGENFCLLEWKEIENYIPQNVIIATANKRWQTFNSRDGSDFNPSSIKDNAFELKTVGIGSKLEKFVARSNSVNSDRKFFEGKSGTIKDKGKFCDTACALMKSEDMEWSLTPELEKLCDQIWSFVEKNNKI